MRVGLILPVFERSPALAFEVARRSEDDGVDGVFSYDHLFPINRPDRPALAAVAMLAAIAVTTERIRLGTLVSRVTLLPTPVLVSAFATLDQVSAGRIIAGVGTGDSLTRAEIEAYGLDFPSVDERIARLAQTARLLRDRGIRTWVGGRSARVRDVAATEADAWNSWGGPVEELAAFARRGRGEATWAGPPPADGDLPRHLADLGEAGVGWAVYGPPPTVDWARFVPQLAEAAKGVR